MEEKKIDGIKLTTTIIFVLVTAALFLGVGFWAGGARNTSSTDETTATTTTTATAQVSASSTSTADVTANWATYTDKTNGFSFKYPSSWVKDTNITTAIRLTHSDTSIYAIGFKDPATEGANRQSDQKNVFVSIDNKSGTNLANFLVSKFKKAGTELEDYQVGSSITLGTESGYKSDISCCGGNDLSYVAEHGSYVYSLGTNYKDDSELSQIASTFQFTK